MPKNFVLEERLDRYADLIEQRPERLRGRWASACWPIGGTRGAAAGFSEVHLDLGCGKGAACIELARRSPDILFIGMDAEPVCVAYAAQHTCESGLRNIVIVPRAAAAINKVFAPGELARIELNFPTPHPKRRHAHLRLTSIDHLVAFRRVLANDGLIALRTDSQPLRDYSLVQLESAGYELMWISDDVGAEQGGFAATEYERRLVKRGASVLGVCGRLGPPPSPAQIETGRRGEQSLLAYLPGDLAALRYIPLGMESSVDNLRRARAAAARRAGIGEQTRSSGESSD